MSHADRDATATPDERSEAPRAPPGGPRLAPGATPAERLLALQHAAGNRAVGALLARAPKTKRKGPPKPAPPDPHSFAARRISHIVLPGVGEIEILSWSWGGPRKVEGANAASELSIMSPHGEHSSALMLAVADGTRFEEATLHYYSRHGGQSLWLALKRATLTSYQTGGGPADQDPTDTWSISPEEVKVEYDSVAP
jgi:hypothetical protein